MTIEHDFFTWPNEQILELWYPKTPKIQTIAYLTMIVIKKNSPANTDNSMFKD